jgi:hypothetical protein
MVIAAAVPECQTIAATKLIATVAPSDHEFARSDVLQTTDGE